MKTASARHRWDERIVISAQKSERQCNRCGLVMASRHEFENGREIHWKEFWRELELVGRGSPVPLCDARLETSVGGA